MNAKLLFNLMLVVFTTFTLAAQDLPEPWRQQDIGTAQVAGTGKHADGVFTLQGTMDLWGAADGFHYVWQPAHGDVVLVARVASMDNPGKVAHAKAGLCIRETTDAGARCVALCVTHGDGVQFTCREATDGKTARVLPDAALPKTGVAKGVFPCWLKLVRHGNEFSGYESADGETWSLTARIKIEFKADAVIGLTSSSHTKDTLTTSVFDHVKLAALVSTSGHGALDTNCQMAVTAPAGGALCLKMLSRRKFARAASARGVSLLAGRIFAGRSIAAKRCRRHKASGR